MQTLSLAFLWSLVSMSLFWTINNVSQAEPAKNQLPSQALQTEAVIQHEFQPHIGELMIISALDADSKKFDKQETADRLFVKIQKNLAEQKNQDPDAAMSRKISSDAISLLYFYMNRLNLEDSKAKVKIVAQWLSTAAKAVEETSKKPSSKVKAQYYNHLARYILSDGADGISDLLALVDQLKNDPNMSANVHMLAGYSLALSPSTAAQGLTYINSAVANVSVHGRVAQRLIEAYIDYGLDADGKPHGGVKPTADGKLGTATQIAHGMPPGLQYLVMDTAIYIWLQSHPESGHKAPQLLLEGFTGLVPMDALREREATAALLKQDLKTASRIYKELAANFIGKSLGLQLDKRVWDIELTAYQKTKQWAELETTYFAMMERYPSNKIKKDSDHALVITTIVENYRKLLDDLLNQALQASTTQASKNQIMQSASRYAKQEADRNLTYPIKQKLAQIYKNSNMYKEAVEVYLDMAKDQGLKNYLLAIEAQSRLANWPAQPPFDPSANGDATERTRLLGIMETVSKIKNGEDWLYLSHIGLLQRALGQAKKTEELWLAGFKKAQPSKYVSEAAGLLINEFNASKRTADFIDLAHLLTAKKIGASSKGKNLNYAPWLADALYMGGIADLQSKNYARSIKYLDEFAQNNGNDPRIPSANLSLSQALKGSGKLVAALNVMRATVEKFPKFPQRPQSILQAAEWGTQDKATFEYTFYFYGKYMLDYKTESNIPQIRLTLAELYYKRKLYGWAARLYKEQTLATKLSREQQLFAAIKLMDIEEQFGEAKDAFWGAQRVGQLAKPGDPASIHALAFQARYVSNLKEVKGMNEVETKLLTHIKTSKEALEAVGYLRFKRAEMLTRGIVYTENNLLIKDPEGIVKKYSGIFEAERIHYLRVCQIGVTTSCAPAFLRLTNVAKQGAEALNKVQIADTLGANRVNSFKVFKQLYLNKILQARRDYSAQAMKMAKQGTTTALWKDEIVKSLEYEDNTVVSH